jgi:hypothetical protein
MIYIEMVVFRLMEVEVMAMGGFMMMTAVILVRFIKVSVSIQFILMIYIELIVFRLMEVDVDVMAMVGCMMMTVVTPGLFHKVIVL